MLDHQKMTDEEFFEALTADRPRSEPEREMSGPQRVFAFATLWLLGAGVLLALVCGILALVKLMFSLTR